MGTLLRHRVYFIFAGLLILIAAAFNNCSRVQATDAAESSLGGAQNLDPQALISNCANAKATGKIRTVHLQASFPDPGKVCSWGTGGNLSIQDGSVRARTEQSQSFQIPNVQATICNIQMSSSVVSRFYYDDNVILTLNGYILASTTNFTRHFQASNGYYLYDWSRLVNQDAQNSAADSASDQQYCAGQGEGISSCQFPETETSGTAQLQIGEKVIQTILGMTDSAKFNLNLITTGDNDSTDCQHVPIDLNLDVDYIAN